MATSDTLSRIQAALARSGDGSSDFDLNPGFRPKARDLRPAGVLVALVERPRGLSVLLTKRASGLKHHPGQIAFPGGKVDPTDASVTAAALREAHEEVGLDPAQVAVLGQMPIHETVTGFAVTPVLGHVQGDFSPVVEAGEVDEAFFVPLDHLMNPDAYSIQRRRWLGQWRSFYTVPWGPYYIWGATARMLRALAQRLD
tara:strand:+ start:852 stop:1448 length:597 start_codon:yes stop_codon:yes gene_type:complete